MTTKNLLLPFLMITGLLTLFAFKNKELNIGQLPEEEAWMTPTGVVIPLAFSTSWESYIAVNGKKFTTRSCTLPDGSPGIYCISGKPDNCSKAFDCTLCGNCGN